MVTGHPYLRSLLRLLLTMPSYFVAVSTVLAVRCAACFLPLGNVGLAPPYLCQVGCMTVDPPMLMSSRAQSRRVSHVVGPTVRGRRDVATRSTFVISKPMYVGFIRGENIKLREGHLRCLNTKIEVERYFPS
ncbi:hypothetical protein GW17_00031613 [Ensete ventricosum]|nr:hypothetical protein GW17_00031613 [Ensete ventricosum]